MHALAEQPRPIAAQSVSGALLLSAAVCKIFPRILARSAHCYARQRSYCGPSGRSWIPRGSAAAAPPRPSGEISGGATCIGLGNAAVPAGGGGGGGARGTPPLFLGSRAAAAGAGPAGPQLRHTCNPHLSAHLARGQGRRHVRQTCCWTSSERPLWLRSCSSRLRRRSGAPGRRAAAASRAAASSARGAPPTAMVRCGSRCAPAPAAAVRSRASGLAPPGLRARSATSACCITCRASSIPTGLAGRPAAATAAPTASGNARCPSSAAKPFSTKMRSATCGAAPARHASPQEAAAGAARRTPIQTGASTWTLPAAACLAVRRGRRCASSEGSPPPGGGGLGRWRSSTGGASPSAGAPWSPRAGC
ncbi:uncharacterized protein LOC144114573 isoform X2 [Amblyomma americanum]